MSKQRRWFMAFVGFMLLGLSTGALAEKSLTALIPWQAHGQVYQVGLETMQFLGAFEGIVYVQTSEGELNEGFIKCPVSQIFDRKSKKGSGTGHCMITPSAGEVVYADLNCSGDGHVCHGTFTLTGGTGKYKGVTGSSKLMIRSSLDSLIVGMPSGSEVNSATGIALLSELKYSIPGTE